MAEIYKIDDEIDAQEWSLPQVEPPKSHDDGTTNAMNRTREWKYEPPEEEVAPEPLTAEDVEAIRVAAYEEGLQQGIEAGQEKGYAEGFEKGQQAGHEQGQIAGHEEGVAAGQSEIETQIAALSDIVTKLAEPLGMVEHALQKELVVLAAALARSVVKTELVTNENIIFQALSEGLKVLPIQEKSYQVQMHPDDIQLVKSHFSEEEIARQNWHFIDTPDLARGGCDIVTQSNAVDITIEKRVKDVIDHFLLEQGLTDYSGERE